MNHHSVSSLTGPTRRPERLRPHASHAGLGVILVAGLSFIFAGSVAAIQPMRTVVTPAERVIPAGFGCAFDVLIDPDAAYLSTRTEFSDGRVVFNRNGYLTLTNLETDATFVWHDDYQRTETYNPATNDLIVDNSGRMALALWPGDVGFSGEAGDNGEYFGAVGHLRATLDLDTGFFTGATLRGWSIDLCAALSE